MTFLLTNVFNFLASMKGHKEVVELLIKKIDEYGRNTLSIGMS